MRREVSWTYHFYGYSQSNCETLISSSDLFHSIMDPRTFLLFSLSLFGADALVATAARPVVGRFGRHAPLIRCAADAEGLCVTDADTAAAARRVQKAASKFGKTQGKLANDWVEEALNGGASKGDTLMAKSLVLFEECVIDDEDGGAKCKASLHEALATLPFRPPLSLLASMPHLTSVNVCIPLSSGA